MVSQLLQIIAATLLPLSSLVEACTHTATTEALIPWLYNPTGTFDFTDAPKVKTWFSKTPGSVTRSYEFTVDTGTCGIAIGAPALTDFDPSECTPDNVGYEFLTSSKVLYTGCWIQRDVLFNHDNTANEVVAHLPILAVTAKTICPSYRLGIDTTTCPSGGTSQDPTGVRMMGIGFGRTADGQPQGTPGKNPLLNIREIRHTSVVGSPLYSAGYKITPQGLITGLTLSNYDNAGFLDRQAQLSGGSGSPPHDVFTLWGEAPGCMQINGAPVPCLAGTVLLDTGVNQSYIRVPVGMNFPTHSDGSGGYLLNDGLLVDVSYGQPRAAGETYIVGDTSDPETPTKVYNYHDDTRAPFVNTGRHAYRTWEVAYDPICGVLAFHSL